LIFKFLDSNLDIRLHTHYKFNCLPTTAVQERQHVDTVGCRTFLAGWSACLSVIVLQIHTEFVRICSRCLASTCSPFVTGLAYTSPDFS
jgi:hypothetical protein